MDSNCIVRISQCPVLVKRRPSAGNEHGKLMACVFSSSISDIHSTSLVLSGSEEKKRNSFQSHAHPFVGRACLHHLSLQVKDELYCNTIDPDYRRGACTEVFVSAKAFPLLWGSGTVQHVAYTVPKDTLFRQGL